MKQTYLIGLLSLPVLAQAQAPVITSLSPIANARAVARTSSVTATFSQALTAGAAAGLKVYSAQRGGLRARATTPATVNGNSLVFMPTAYRFSPGEVVAATITKAAASSGGALARPRVVQFTVAAEGTGRGQFLPGSTSPVGTGPTDVAAGDVDGDGDLDIVTINGYSSPGVQVLLNGGDATGSNTGIFTVGSTATVGTAPVSMVLGDVDGDGDLDIAVANSGSSTVSIRLNGGNATGSNTGVFSGSQTISLNASPKAVLLADMDNDGDLDLLTVNNTNTVIVALNGGDDTGSNTGIFRNGTSFTAGYNPNGLAVGDVDGDGDLDIITANNNLGTSNTNGTLRVTLNGGDASGTNVGYFSSSSTVAVGNTPVDVAIGDVDGDGDLDLLAVNFNSGTVSVRLNGGNATGSNTGIFSGGSEVSVGSFPGRVILGDVDADGDADLVVPNLYNTVNVRLNGGDATGSSTGAFGGGGAVTTGGQPEAIQLADLDGDGDLDLLAADMGNNLVSVRLNGGTQVLAVQGEIAEAQASFAIAPTILADDLPHYAYTGPLLPAEATIAIYSLTGQCIWMSTGTVAASGKLPVRELASGWYITRLSSANHSYVSHFYKP